MDSIGKRVRSEELEWSLNYDFGDLYDPYDMRRRLSHKESYESR